MVILTSILLLSTRKFILKIGDALLTELDDHLVSCSILLRCLQGGLLVPIRFCQGIYLVLILLLLDVHGAQVLREELLDLADSLLHRLKLDCPLLVQLECFRVILEVLGSRATRRLFTCRGHHVQEGAVASNLVRIGVTDDPQPRSVGKVQLDVSFLACDLSSAGPAQDRAFVEALLVGCLGDRLS